MHTEVKIQQIFGKDVMRHDNFRMLVLLSASLVIKEIDRWQPNGDLSNYPSDSTILSHLSKNVKWSAHGFINALQTHVEMIYAYQEAIIKSQETKEYFCCPDIHEAILIAKALENYQGWKTQIVRREKEVHGEHWGDACGFNQAKWNENNEKFLNLYKKE